MAKPGNKRKATTTSLTHTNETNGIENLAGSGDAVDDVSATLSGQVSVGGLQLSATSLSLTSIGSNVVKRLSPAMMNVLQSAPQAGSTARKRRWPACKSVDAQVTKHITTLLSH